MVNEGAMIDVEIRELEEKIFQLRQKQKYLKEREIQECNLLREITAVDGWVINSDGRYYICSKSFDGALGRRLYDDEVHIVQMKMKMMRY